MLNSEKKVTIELVNKSGDRSISANSKMTNPLNNKFTAQDKLAMMVKAVLEEELPQLKNNSLLYDLVLYSLVEKMNTVQNVENVLSYIKDNNVKEVQDVSFRKGEVHIKCSV
ncbi:hypothetical protein IJD44_02295 [bacterium]|nr:hypothetical protein [bacterium]